LLRRLAWAIFRVASSSTTWRNAVALRFVVLAAHLRAATTWHRFGDAVTHVHDPDNNVDPLSSSLMVEGFEPALRERVLDLLEAQEYRIISKRCFGYWLIRCKVRDFG
jgi:hypothetical protein